MIESHLKKYPQMETSDIIKLYYQKEFGGGHLIDDSNKSLEYLKKECAALTNSDYRIEDIGNGYCRFYLFNANDIELNTINMMFVLSSKNNTGKISNLIRELRALNIDQTEVEAYINQNCPMVSHSLKYNQLYQPHYRVMRSDLALFYPIILRINELLETQDTLTIAIDGMCGSGKTTLSSYLHKLYDSNLFHLDDFFLQPHQRTTERYNTPGENVDHERFKQQVLIPLMNKETVYYNKFDCKTMRLSSTITPILYKKINIIEGTYSMHPDLVEHYDFTIGLQIDSDKQLERILKRNGPIILQDFIEKWIPLETLYLNNLHILNKVNYLFKV